VTRFEFILSRYRYARKIYNVCTGVSKGERDVHEHTMSAQWNGRPATGMITICPMIVVRLRAWFEPIQNAMPHLKNQKSQKCHP